jgi:hypothetical protein
MDGLAGDALCSFGDGVALRGCFLRSHARWYHPSLLSFDNFPAQNDFHPSFPHLARC